MKLAAISEAEEQALLDGADELRSLEGETPSLLEAAQYAGLLAKGVLAEARVTFKKVPSFIEDLVEGTDSEFTELRVLLLDGKLVPVGFVGIHRSQPPIWRHFTHGGIEPLVAGLQRVDEVEEQSGVQFEVRLLVVTDLLCEALILLPQPPAQTVPRFLCLSPRHGGPEPNHPMNSEDYLAHLEALRKRLLI